MMVKLIKQKNDCALNVKIAMQCPTGELLWNRWFNLRYEWLSIIYNIVFFRIRLNVIQEKYDLPHFITYSHA